MWPGRLENTFMKKITRTSYEKCHNGSFPWSSKVTEAKLILFLIRTFLSCFAHPFSASEHVFQSPCPNPACFFFKAQLRSHLFDEVTCKPLTLCSKIFLRFDGPCVTSLLNANMNNLQRHRQVENNVTPCSISSFHVRFGKEPCKWSRELAFLLFYLYQIEILQRIRW